jgi:acetyl-CoA acetyltransferase
MASRMKSTGVAIVGVGSTAIARHADRGLGAIATEAALAAIADAGLRRDDIDGYVGCPSAPNVSALHVDGVDEVSSTYMTAALSLKNPSWVMDVEGMTTGMVVAAAHALACGACNYVIAVRALYNPRDRKYSHASADFAVGADQFTLPYGIGPGGGRFAQWLQRYMHDTGATREDLHEIANIGRKHAQLNPLAVWKGKGELTREEYLGARWICEPMCLYDSDMPVTAAGALVLTTAERAKDLPHRPAHLLSYSNASDPRKVFESAGVKPSDIDVAQIYDGYSPMVWNWLGKLGFCDPDQAHRFARGSRITFGGELPLNTFGGALGEGRLHGMGHVREAALQAMGRAGERQISGARYSLVQVGVPERSWILLLGSEAIQD